MVKNFDYEYKNMEIDLCSCYEPTEEPPQSLLDEWKARAEAFWAEKLTPTLENSSFYVREPDGTMYFYCGNTRIRVKEHFADKGKPIGTLIEDVIQYAAGHGKSVIKPVCSQ